MEYTTSEVLRKASLFGQRELTYVGMARVGLTLRPGETCAVCLHGPDRVIYAPRFTVLAYEGQSFGALCLRGYDGMWRLMGYTGQWDLAPVYLNSTALSQLGFAAAGNPDGTWTVVTIPEITEPWRAQYDF